MVKQPVKIIYANDVSQRNYEYIHYWTVWFFNYKLITSIIHIYSTDQTQPNTRLNPN